MKLVTALAACVIAFAVAAPAAAQQTTTPTLYKRLGGYDAIAAVTDDFVGRLVGHHNLDLQLGDEVDAVLGAAIRFFLSLLAAETANLGYRHAVIAGADEGIFDGIDLVMTNNGFDLAHEGNSGKLRARFATVCRLCFSITNAQQIMLKHNLPLA